MRIVPDAGAGTSPPVLPLPPQPLRHAPSKKTAREDEIECWGRSGSWLLAFGAGLSVAVAVAVNRRHPVSPRARRMSASFGVQHCRRGCRNYIRKRSCGSVRTVDSRACVKHSVGRCTRRYKYRSLARLLQCLRLGMARRKGNVMWFSRDHRGVHVFVRGEFTAPRHWLILRDRHQGCRDRRRKLRRMPAADDRRTLAGTHAREPLGLPSSRAVTVRVVVDGDREIESLSLQQMADAERSPASVSPSRVLRSRDFGRPGCRGPSPSGSGCGIDRLKARVRCFAPTFVGFPPSRLPGIRADRRSWRILGRRFSREQAFLTAQSALGQEKRREDRGFTGDERRLDRHGLPVARKVHGDLVAGGQRFQRLRELPQRGDDLCRRSSMMTSPSWRPAFSAGEPGVVPLIRTPGPGNA